MLCPDHYGGLLFSIGIRLVETSALVAGVDDLVVSSVMTKDAAHGKDMLGLLHEDRTIFFGKSSASADAPDMPFLEPVDGRLRLPSLLSSWWHDENHTESAIRAIMSLLSN